MANLIWVIKTYGPFLLAVCFFIWRDYKREDRLSTRINELEEEQRNVILPLVRDCTAVVAKNTDVMDQNMKVMLRLEKALDNPLPPICRYPCNGPGQ
jgi:hypothetical protein